MSTPLCSASLRAAASARTLNPMTTAFDASEVDVRLADAADCRVDDVDLHLGGRQFGEACVSAS